jgi:hypothetical protein
MPTQTRPAPDRSRFQVQTITKQALLAGGQLLVAGIVAIVWETIAKRLGMDRIPAVSISSGGPSDSQCVPHRRSWLLFSIVGSQTTPPLLPVLVFWVWLPPTALLAPLTGWDFLAATWIGDGSPLGTFGTTHIRRWALSDETYSLIRLSQRSPILLEFWCVFCKAGRSATAEVI